MHLEGEYEIGAGAESGLDGDGASCTLADLFAEVEGEAVALVSVVVGFEEGLIEYIFLCVFRNPKSCIVHYHFYQRLIFLKIDATLYRCSLILKRILIRIRQQCVQHKLESRPIALERILLAMGVKR